ncbi:MAG: DUF3301 domain-containing protein [Betaproteobacteria bacterium HGW-Betaproteobacteria-14]|nr:MAG: DUF3301 domain-containing protein [Betaproteobacteria bacterium HGW-Betaproteobacteria-14]
MPVLELIGLAVLAGGGWLWLDSLRARDIGIAAARAACEAEGLQLLDDTVSIGSLKPARNEDGQLLLRRVYTFEYSDTGDNRRSGSVVLLGHRVMLLNVGLRPTPAYTLH